MLELLEMQSVHVALEGYLVEVEQRVDLLAFRVEVLVKQVEPDHVLRVRVHLLKALFPF